MSAYKIEIQQWFPIISNLIIASFVVSCILVVRKAYFHPLSKFPGPLTARFSNFNYSRSYLGGRQPYDVLKLHLKYGPVVRTAPNELSFDTTQSWKDIYGPRKGHEPFIKSAFYDGGNFADQAHSIVSERDPAKHSEMRKFISNAFSDRSLREQEYLIDAFVDEFVERIGERGAANGGVDMTLWTNLLTFDIIGELAFGESFGGIKTGILHNWIVAVMESMAQASLSDTLQRFPGFGLIFLTLNSGWYKKLLAGAEQHQRYVIDLVARRIKAKSDKKDFMSYLLKHREQAGISDIQLTAHASDFVIAGSETSATTLATVIYFVCRNPAIQRKLQSEVRSAFKAYSEIDGKSTSSLRYILAVCLEALRMFPPLPLALPRIIPRGGDTVDGHFIPEGTIVATNPMAASMNDKNFHNPWTFDPERWLCEESQDQLEASQPFSLGTRSCLGRGLAWLELRLTLAKMVFRYDLELTNEDVDWHRDVRMSLLWEKPKLMVRLTPRKGM